MSWFTPLPVRLRLDMSITTGAGHTIPATRIMWVSEPPNERWARALTITVLSN